MASGGATVNRLREFLRELPPNARSTLIAELERKMLCGEDVAGADLILTELRRLFRESRETAPRYGNAARLFYKPLEPFIVDDVAGHLHPGRIERVSLEPLWSWIRRDLLPDDAQEFTDAAGKALLDDPATADLIAREFQDRVAAAIAEALTEANGDANARRVVALIGTPRAEDDARSLMRILTLRDPLAMLADHLPGYIADLAGSRLTATKEVIAAAAGQNPDIGLYALVLVMPRLAAPWQLIRLASPSDDTPITIVMAELAFLTAQLRNDLESGGVGTVGLLQMIHDAARGLRVELNPPADSPRGKELAALRSEISRLLQSKIESMPGRVRQLLRPRPSVEIRANSALDEADVAETEALIGLVSACRNFAGELALNETTQRSYSDLQQFLDSSAGALLDALRHAGETDRSFRQSQADAAVRFCRKTFGADYAAMLTRAAELASQREPKESQPTGG